MRFMMIRSFSIVFFCLAVISFTLAQQKPDNDLKVWFVQPAMEWNVALPVGNGDLGAMVFGGIDDERIQLNEKTLWAGSRNDFVNPQAKSALPLVRKLLFDEKYAEARDLAQQKLMGKNKRMSSYQTLGDLLFQFKHPEGDVKNYRRELNLDSAVASVSYNVNDIRFSREVFCSAPGKVLIIKLSASAKQAISYKLSFARPGDKANIEYNQNGVTVFEHVNDGDGVKAAAHIRIVNDGGESTASLNGYEVRDANQSILIVTAATDYYGADPVLESRRRIDAVLDVAYGDLRSAHIKDYQKYFNRVTLDVGTSDAVFFPTDLRLQALQNGNDDPQLAELYYQFGRYLLISSSRPGSLPANLQGVWADGLNPPWDADYHININIQMNYWPAEVANLSEMHEPFFTYLDSLRRDGRRTATAMYGMKGVVAHFTSDAWYFTEPYGETQWAMWPMGYAWSVSHLWERYLFQQDKAFLRAKAYPMLKDAAVFCLDWLTDDPRTGKLVSGPSISPENTFRTPAGEIATMVMGPTMDHMIIRQLFENTIEASLILDVDAGFRKSLSNALKKLAPTRTTADGRIMEWTRNFDEPEPGHRHISHLYGLHPGNEITRQRNPELLEAARKTIDHRLSNGGGHTGWSRAWIINFFARLHDGEKAHDNLRELLKKSTLPNLLDNHPPFQIDGNFGAVAGISEMLLQSHAGEIELLPALPLAWPGGEVRGLMARGGFEVSIIWKDNQLHRVIIHSRHGNAAKVRYRNQFVSLPANGPAVYVFDGNLQPIDK